MQMDSVGLPICYAYNRMTYNHLPIKETIDLQTLLADHELFVILHF